MRGVKRPAEEAHLDHSGRQAFPVSVVMSGWPPSSTDENGKGPGQLPDCTDRSKRVRLPFTFEWTYCLPPAKVSYFPDKRASNAKE